MWDGICEHEKDLDGRFLDTLTHKGTICSVKEGKLRMVCILDFKNKKRSDSKNKGKNTTKHFPGLDKSSTL